ncbi:alpha/beta fold hydrolase [Acuticoccus sp. M5D2P5]|uniref:alpha/beta fold hydrolase n=1 Tax=Acuticoccus kalidii TaxID=2910977 RepID=UPI001F27FACA|nr:alpha/beta fold hydrolase [Acuticoccus kalidii]MCF3934835.1 alpha/beta fold hydrolase [Acuticoccus kalidii]
MMQHQPPPPNDPKLFANLRALHHGAIDEWRRTQARTLDMFGFGVRECPYEVIAEGPRWRLRHYLGEAGSGGGNVPLLMVPAPIKRPYIWDILPNVSVVRFCLNRGFGVYLLEWRPPGTSDGNAGIEAYAQAIADASEAAEVHAAAEGPPVVIGHSLGGTLAAIAATLRPDRVRGLVLLGAPLSFAPGSSPFRDLVGANGRHLSGFGTVAGSELSQSCAALAPSTFVWTRWIDGFLSVSDPAAFDIHVRIERWALDEVPLPGRLVQQIVDWLYCEDRFGEGKLFLENRALGPEDLKAPVLAVVNDADEIGPRATVDPFFARMNGVDTDVVEHPAEIGVGLQHLAVLAGRRANAETWPSIADWIMAHS